MIHILFVYKKSQCHEIVSTMTTESNNLNELGNSVLIHL